MKQLGNYRRFLLTLSGILSILLSLGSSQVAFAATSHSNIAVKLVAHRSNQDGGTITYTATMTNLGPDDASSVDVGFALPKQLRLTSMTCDLGISPDTPFCEYSSLKAGQSVVSILVAKPTPGARKHNISVTTSASVFFEVDCSFDSNCTLDPDMSNNSASVTVKLTGK
jgi:uncharacterized repeat protein (TIGR01451 family)